MISLIRREFFPLLGGKIPLFLQAGNSGVNN
jgi:hypothetical protein